MYAQIMLECQTKTDYVSCQYCIGKEACHLRQEMGEKVAVNSDRCY
jgi:hypothetical protein